MFVNKALITERSVFFYLVFISGVGELECLSTVWSSCCIDTIRENNKQLQWFHLCKVI